MCGRLLRTRMLRSDRGGVAPVAFGAAAADSRGCSVSGEQRANARLGVGLAAERHTEKQVS